MKKIIWLFLSLSFLVSISHARPQTRSQLLLSERSAQNAWLEINASAFEQNILEIQKKLTKETKLCAVMKADAYGHGIELLVPSILKLKVPCVAITDNAEAIKLRRGGFQQTIMRIRSADYGEILSAHQSRLQIEELLGNLELAKKLSHWAKKNKQQLRFHLALNSGGMSRNGIELSEKSGRAEAVELVKLPSLKIVGIMTHYPVEAADDVRQGLNKFLEQTDWLIIEACLKREELTLHTANSYATLEVPETHLDLVRVGGALYGDTVPTYSEFKRVLQFKSKVAVVNRYPKGNTVNYDRTYTLTRDSLLANIPVGYSNGYRRIFSNKASVLIRGLRFPIVGRVTMNTLMVDVTDHPEISAGDEVVLFGKQGENEITQKELESLADTILCEIYTLWGKVNPKVLVR